MNFILFKLFIYLGTCAECPEKPSDYLDLPSSPQSGNKYYSCGKEFGYDSQFGLTNSILSIYYCNFRNIIAIFNKESLGIIKIKIDENIPSSLTGGINIEYCTFSTCYGAILIDSTDSSRKFNIYNCTFYRCQAMKGAAMIDFKSVNGNIEKCYFKDCLTTDSTSGYISFNPPKIEGNDKIFTITDNLFEHSIQNSYSFLSICNENCRLNFSKNKVIVPELSIEIYVISYPNGANVNDWIFGENCIEPFFPDAITTTNNQKIVDSFTECKKEGVVCPPVLIPESKKYENHCYENEKDQVIDIISKNKLIALFSCSFSNVKSNDDHKGGAVFICLDYKFDDVYLPFFVYNCSFDQCTAFDGGAIYIDSLLSYVPRIFEIKDCKFTSNKCFKSLEGDTFGGAISIYSYMNDFEISGCEFESNEAGNGGAIYYSTYSSSSSFAKEFLLSDDDFALRVSDCKFSKNKATENGGALCFMIKNKQPENSIEIVDCLFNENRAEKNELRGIDEEKPENGGSIYLELDFSSKKKFSFSLNDCSFSHNIASSKGGAICIKIGENEPLNTIEINRCTFKQNQACTEIQSYGSDICFTDGSEKLNAFDSALKIDNCNFSESLSKHRGGSIFVSILNIQTLKTIEINKCLFNEISSTFGGSIDIESVNPSVLFHISDCEFQGESSLFFNGIYGHIEKCRFNDIKNVIPIYYECNSDEKTSEKQSFAIEKCNFYQRNEIYSLIFIVPKISSRFAFIDNYINIANGKTFVFNCNGDAKLEGSWGFNGNSINPDDENIINSENATKIHFYASCLKGFVCTSHRLPGLECEKNKHCSVNGDEQSIISFIDISGSNFNRLKDEERKGGAAIYVLNYGVLCSNSKFNECSSENEGGGAIYIHVNKIIDSSVSITDSSFSKCRAIYGGAIFIYSDKDENFVSINNCKFTQNKANVFSDGNNQRFGGSAIFFITKNGDVDNCDFVNNDGNAIKVSNKFENSFLSIDKFKGSISFDNCSFNLGVNSSSSIFYHRCNKNDVDVDVKNCFFKGKLSRKSHHIDGFSSFEKEKISCFHFVSCKFEGGIKNAINLKSLYYDDYDDVNIKILFSVSACTVLFCISFVAFIIVRRNKLEGKNRDFNNSMV